MTAYALRASLFAHPAAIGMLSPNIRKSWGTDGKGRRSAAGNCTRCRLFVQVESPPLEVSEHYGVYRDLFAALAARSSTRSVSAFPSIPDNAPRSSEETDKGVPD
jgi:hypothetical protein